MAKFKIIDQSKNKENPYIYNGYLNSKNEFDTMGHIVWLNSKEYYFGEWFNGVRTGQGAYKFPSGDCYYGGFKSADKHGLGLHCSQKNEFYLGIFVDNYRSGLGV